MTWFQLKWMGYSIVKALVFGLALSGLLVLLSIPQGGVIDNTVLSRVSTLAAFSVDNIITFVAVGMGLSIGLTVSSWDAVSLPIKMNFKEHVSKAIWSVALAVIIVFVTIQSTAIMSNVAEITYGLSLINMVIAGSLALSQSWRSYIVYGVMTKTERAAHKRHRSDSTAIKSVFKWFIPFVDRTRLWGATAVSLLVVGLAVSLSSQTSLGIETAIDPKYVVAVMYPVLLTLLSCLFGLVVRLMDSIRPGSRKNSLYPRWEKPYVPEDKGRISLSMKQKLKQE